MRNKRRGTPGFTIIELMMVVFIIGVLCALGAPAFSRYVKRSRTAEASGHLQKMWSGSVAYFSSDHADSRGVTMVKQFPATTDCPTDPVRELPCCQGTGQKCPGSPAAYSQEPWVSLQFNIPDPHLFRANYCAQPDALQGFSAEANADLDCDTIQSRFIRRGQAVGMDIQSAPIPIILNETE